MRRWLATAFAALAVLVGAARPVFAGPTVPVTVPPDAIGIAIAQVNSPGLAVTLDPGGSDHHDIVISNHTADLRLTVKLTSTDATGSLGANAATWVAFSDDAVQLEPHAASTIAMTMSVPNDTQPGSALAHVTATVDSAVSAADGSPVTGTTHLSFPIAITVRGTPTAQIAVADVHRTDQGSNHILALVLRNYGSLGASVAGHVKVVTGSPQTIPFTAQLAPSGDTTVNLPWKAPPKGTPAELAVDVEYGNGDVASWSSTLGGPPTTLVPADSANATAATVAPPTTASTDSSNDSSAPAAAASPGWKPTVPFLIGGAIVLAGLWFAFEMKRSKKREQELPIMPPFFMAPPASGSDATAELAKQLVRLTEIIVDLATNQEPTAAPRAAPARARSPDVDEFADMPPPDRGPPAATDRASPRLVPAPPPDEPTEKAPARSASPTPSVDPRSEFPEHDPRTTALSRLMALEAERKRLRRWMDDEETSLIPEFPVEAVPGTEAEPPEPEEPRA